MPNDVVPLSVIVATTQGWPIISPCIESLKDQVGEVGGELLVLDASGLDAPDLEPHVRWLSFPSSMSVFQLRHAGYEISRGEIVAMTEDHCRPAADWCQRTLALHAEHPEAAAIGGALENGTPDHLVDWAAFVVTQVPFVAPLPNGPVTRTTGASNVSLKRRAVERLPSHPEFGTIELFDVAAVVTDGEVLYQDDSLVVRHDQSMGIVGTSATEFHNGRTVGGFRRGVMDGRDWLRIGAAGVLPLYRTARGVTKASRKRIPRGSLLAAVPLILWLEYCTSAGQLLGYATGPGDSPRRLH